MSNNFKKVYEDLEKLWDEEDAVEEAPAEEPVEEVVEEEKTPLEVLKDKVDIHGEEDSIVIAEKGQLDNPEAPKIEVEVSEEEKEILEPEFNEEEQEEVAPIEESVEEEQEGSSEINSIEEFIDELKEYDGSLLLNFKALDFDGKEHIIREIEFDDSEDGKLVAIIKLAEEEFDDSKLAMSDEDVEKVNEPFEGEDGQEIKED